MKTHRNCIFLDSCTNFAHFTLFIVNPGYVQIKTICEILRGGISYDNDGSEELSPDVISCFKYAPIVSCDAEIIRLSLSLRYVTTAEVLNMKIPEHILSLRVGRRSKININFPFVRLILNYYQCAFPRQSINTLYVKLKDYISYWYFRR